MILRTLVLVLTLSGLMIGFGPPNINAVVDSHCDTWAADWNYPRNSYRMRQLGCVDPNLDAEYVARPGVCNQLARQAARAGLRGHDVVVYVENKRPQCYWDADLRNYDVAMELW